MRVHTEVVYQMLPNGSLELVSEKGYEYFGPLALCDRWAQGAAKSAETEAKTKAADLGGAAASELGAITPFAQRYMTATHGFTPSQTGELLTAAEAPIGAGLGAAEEGMNLEAARTRNPAGYAKALQQMARDRMKAGAGASEGVAAQDIMEAKKENLEGANMMSGLYGENLKGQLDAMGQESKDISTELEAGKSGWYQNLQAGVKMAADAASAFKGFTS